MNFGAFMAMPAVFVHLMAGETDFRLKERLAIGDQLRVIRSLGRR
jgi:hypothetical protein